MKFLEIGRTGLTSILLHPMRSLTTTVAVLAVLLPFVVGLAISHGVQDEAEASIDYGADLYLSGLLLGQKAPVPLSAIAEIENIKGVAKVVPRIIGHLSLGITVNHENVVVVGLPRADFPTQLHCLEGELPRSSAVNELVVGSDLARRLGLKVGSPLRPFYHNDRGDRNSQVVGIFQADVSLWQSRLMFTTLETAQSIFNQEGLASDLLIYCKPGFQDHIATAIRQMPHLDKNRSGLRPLVISRADLKGLLPAGLLHREGIFNLHLTLAWAVGILVVLVTSGFGLAERRREIGILKATGWQTDEILVRGLVESFALSLVGASLAVLGAYVWLKWLNGYWIASVFLTGIDAAPSIPIPYRLAPVPAILAFVIAFVVVMSGTLYSAWRSATAAPFEAMR